MPRLFCFRPGGEDLFLVRVDEKMTMRVARFKEKIIKKMPHVFAGVHPGTLGFYLTIMDENEEKTTRMHELTRLSNNLIECTPLTNEVQPLSRYLGETPPEGKMYIILIRPPSESIKTTVCGAIAETVLTPFLRRHRVIAAAGGSVSTQKRKRTPSSPSPQGNATKRPRVSDVGESIKTTACGAVAETLFLR